MDGRIEKSRSHCYEVGKVIQDEFWYFSKKLNFMTTLNAKSSEEEIFGHFVANFQTVLEQISDAY